MSIKRVFTLIVCGLLAVTVVMASPRKNKAYEDYIRRYRTIAVDEMKKYRIPASITLAQGLLESGAGKSSLARKSNNHFGIKCGSGWRGRTVRYDDDRPNECFRAYKHVKDSYEDHSKFLTSSSRYASLFRLDITDYKGWARGLKKAGYATNPRYADQLIGIIELYRLDKYDKKGGLKFAERFPNPHDPYLANGLVYIIGRPGDTFKMLGKELGISSRKLRKYNELPKDYHFQGGEIIYLEKKNKRAPKGYIIHKVKPGDSMYSISQVYGVRLKYLYKMNKMKDDEATPKVGTLMRIR